MPRLYMGRIHDPGCSQILSGSVKQLAVSYETQPLHAASLLAAATSTFSGLLMLAALVSVLSAERLLLPRKGLNTCRALQGMLGYP